MSQSVQVRKDEYSSIWHRMPSWVISLVLHAGVFLFFVSTTRGCGGSPAGSTGEQFRDFGIYLKDSPENQQDNDDPPTEAEATESSATTVDASPVDAQPPADLDLPATDLPTIGAGPPPMPASIGGSDIQQEVKSGGQLMPGPLGLGPGETAFVDIRDSGDTFVYAIDCSGSMGGNRIAFARAQLTSSLNLLQTYQQFQVMFYNTKVTELSLRAGDRGKLYAANEQNTARAIRAIRAQQPSDGTKHWPALEKAIRLRPDVIFFLTDGSKPVLSVGDMDNLRRLNGGRSRIHCVEFGEGESFSGSSWLKTVARQNGGRYKYIDVSRLP